MGLDGVCDEGRIAGKYCLECGWSVSVADVDSIEEISKRTVEHFVETGHTIESVDRFPSSIPDELRKR